MNSQLPQIDSEIRDQLTRRSAGRLPEALVAEVSAELDRAPAPRARGRLQLPTWRSPRLAAVGMGVALVAILAVAVAFPALNTTPAASLAGYPANRALTTAELAALMAGPALPANTTLVASVTIESRQDVCPMNSRPTIGVVEGMGSQVCVMGSNVSEYLKQAAGTGTFAFRYMAPGYLGLIGEITPASSRLAFRVADDWPMPMVETFLAEGWLGATALQCGATETPDFGDILNPSGYEPCRSSWLSEDGSPAPVIENQAAGSPAESGGSTASPAPSLDMLALHGKARYVTAGGARQIDSIPLETTRGVYVVRSTTGPCPGASPVDSRGCATWQVLAKVADISVPGPTAAPTARATDTPIAGYPADRALTTALPANTAIVASVTIQSRTDVCPMNRYPTIGVVAGMGSQVCVMGAGVSAYLKEAAATGIFAFRYLAPGYLGLLGEIAPAADSKVAFRVADNWPLGGQTFLVEGWLGADELMVQCASTPTAGDVLAPNGEDCPYDDWLGDSSTAPAIEADHEYTAGSPEPSYDPLSLRGNARHVEAGGMRLVDAIDPVIPVYGVYVVRADTGGCPYPSASDTSGCSTWRILARVTDVPAPRASAKPTPTPTTAPPATPVALPTGPLGTAPIGLIGSGNRPLTEGEFATLWAADPAHLAGRIAIVKGPVPTGFECWSAGAADAAVPSPACHIAILDGQIAPEGYWAIHVGVDGKLGIIGELSTPQNSFVFSLEQVLASTANSGDRLLIVDAWLDWANDCDTLPTEPPGTACGYSLLTSERMEWGHMRSLWPSDSKAVGQYVQPDAYSLFSTHGTVWEASHGLYLVESSRDSATILARLEPATP